MFSPVFKASLAEEVYYYFQTCLTEARFCLSFLGEDWSWHWVPLNFASSLLGNTS